MTGNTGEPVGVNLAVDVVLFTIVEDQLNVLLVEREVEPFRGSLALPGGFVLADETLEQAALRALNKETGVVRVCVLYEKVRQGIA